MTLPSPFNVATLDNGTSQATSGAAAIFVTPFRQSATANSAASGYNLYNIVQGSLGGGAGASFDIKNFSTGTERFSFLISGLTLSETPRLTAANRIAASLRLMPAGQSLADYLTYGPSGYALRTGLFTALGSGVLPNKVGIIDAAAGGSAINKSAADVDDTSGLANGPVLTQALSGIAALSAAEQPQMIIWDQGEQGAVAARTDAAYAPGIYTTATNYVFTKLRAAVGAAGGNANLPIVFVKVGRSFSDTAGTGYRRIRAAQRAIIAAGMAIYSAPETYDVEIKDSDHPPLSLGQPLYGARATSAVLRVGVAGLFSADATQKLGPTATVTNPSTSTVQITMASESGDAANVPDNPFGFEVDDATGASIPFTVTRSGSTYTLALATPPSGAVTVAYRCCRADCSTRAACRRGR